MSHETHRSSADEDQQRSWEPVTSRIPEGWDQEVHCERGWQGIILKLVRDIDEAWNGFPADGAPQSCWCPVQVKEKFGGLRFYAQTCVPPGKDDPPQRHADVAARTQRMNELIRKAEEDCAHRCESCGADESGPRWVNRWVRTVCQPCYERWLADDVESVKDLSRAGRRRHLNTTRMYFNMMDVRERKRRGFVTEEPEPGPGTGSQKPEPEANR